MSACPTLADSHSIGYLWLGRELVSPPTDKSFLNQIFPAADLRYSGRFPIGIQVMWPFVNRFLPVVCFLSLFSASKAIPAFGLQDFNFIYWRAREIENCDFHKRMQSG